MKKSKSETITQSVVIVGIANIAKYLGCCENTVGKLIKKGEFGKSIFRKGKTYALNTKLFWS